MLKMRNLLTAAALGLFGTALFIGCAGSDAPEPAANTQAAEDWKQGLDADTVAALAELSDADRAAALAQKTCPVSGEPLGSMGTPRKITVNGREVFICCEGCDEMLRKDPDKYLANLPAE